MDWNGNLRPFVSRPETSFSFLYNYNQYPGIEMKHDPVEVPAYHAVVPAMEKNSYGNQMEKKKRLATNQLESLENSFQEEIKLNPERKMKLARELGLQPRQVATWFQNRRARWKAKQLEHLYDALKKEFEDVSREKQKLQEEVLSLKVMLSEQVAKKPIYAGYAKISSEETVESTSERSNKARGTGHHQIGESSYVFNVDDYGKVMPPYWLGVMPSYP
ncbi:hypothetical protein F0562_016850 [Nyssa sinensis]|uniref:Homeobox-leucine zipper protein n=1 Tax=Nyssa sinensis TaxID=561372 RepID=A0A5J4ZFN0_9ASTE|nr:hypothetical protein F0562_016850 [Nyssa sinensis]